MTVNELSPADPASRRRLIAAGLAGAALGIGGARAASASTPPTTPPPTTTPPTTTAPMRPTPADIELLAMLQSAELSAHDLYRAALEAGIDDPVFPIVAGNHQAYADVLSGLLGGPQGRDDALYEQHLGALQTSDLAAACAAAYDLESTLVVTHGEAIGQLEGLDGATMVASILITESRHCAVLADLGGNGDDLGALLDNDAEPLSAPTEA